MERREFQVLDEQQARQFLLAAAGSPFETIFYLALVTGMRKGELLGLKWTDLDEGKGVLLIQRQLQSIAHIGAVLVPPKTRAGRRAIRLGGSALSQLRAHRERQERMKAAAGPRWQEAELMFTTGIGTPVDPSKLSREFKRMLREAGLPSIRFHDLRHTSISFLLGMGIAINTVQQRADHSKASVTMDIYGHPLDEGQEEAARKTEGMNTPIAGESSRKGLVQ